MKTVLALAIAVFAVSANAAAQIRDVAGKVDHYHWDPSLKVEPDLNRSGTNDSAQPGRAGDSVGLLIEIDGKRLPLVEITADGSKQFGICPGVPPAMSLTAQSGASLNAPGETPHGYKICKACVEVVVSGGECGPIHFYWNTTANRLEWWRG